MKLISVNANELAQEMAAWGVPMNYALAFEKKCRCERDKITLPPFIFNDTLHLTSTRHWLAAVAAFWCCVYRIAESKASQDEAISSIRVLHYVAGVLGCGEIAVLVQEWWTRTYELHQIPALHYSTVTSKTTIH